jgi:hypothetical protein
MVVPCHNILDVLEQPELAEYAGHAVSEFESKNVSMLDGISPATGLAIKSGREEEATRRITSVASAISEPSSDTTAPILETDFFSSAGPSGD